MNNIYSFPKGYESFEKVKQIIETNLPEGYKIEFTEAGGSKGFFGKMQEKASYLSSYGFGSKAKTLGEVDIKKNAYVGVSVLCYSSDGEKHDMISVIDYVPSGTIRFMMQHVLGYVTNFIFPAIYGTPTKVGEIMENVIMNNFEANKLDTSIMGSIKGVGKGLGTVKSSVKE